jgi:hypothetical protein
LAARHWSRRRRPPEQQLGILRRQRSPAGLIIHLADERYDQLVMEVDDPADGAARILQAIGDRSGTER